MHLNYYYSQQYEHLFNPYDKGQTLSNTTTVFASNVYKNHLHKILNFPVNKNYEGTMIYLHDNQATRQTGKLFRKYMYCYVNYYVNSFDNSKILPKWKSYQKSWKEHYINSNYRGTDNGSENNFAEWRLISNRNNKNARILFLVPIDGWNNNYSVKQ